MRAIETLYMGYRFRSRLEARWAAFYDKLGVKWAYEEEGFDLRFDANESVFYLPDFHLEGIGYIEIKPKEPDAIENKKAERLALHTKENVYIFFGEIPFPEPNMEYQDSAHVFLADGHGWDMHQWWCRCATCGKFGIEFEGRSDRICRHGDSDRGHNADDELLREAYAVARAFRF